MRLFSNPVGEGTLFFENLKTPQGVDVAYDPNARNFFTDATFCANRKIISCNWIAPQPGALCQSCAMTAISPDLSMPNAVENWAKAEEAKRWVLDNLRRWQWFGADDTGSLPVFHMLAEGNKPIVMGHAEGVVTINVEESDMAVRADRQDSLDERFRTMIGHMRHEIAHLLWWRLSIVPEFIETFRALFGDERSDYSDALNKHYQGGPPAHWRTHFLTPYASAHPHEDWAETTAHLLHLIDIADSFQAAGFSKPNVPGPNWDPYDESDPAKVISAGATIALGLNHVNRSMGLQDVYPFVLSDTSRKKLAFVHGWLRQAQDQEQADGT